MRTEFNIIKNAALAVLALVLAAGCISEKETSPVVDAKDVMVMLNVTADDMQTKAMDESAIRTMRIFAFDQSGNQVGHVYSPVTAGSFHMILSVPDGQSSMAVDFYAIANEGAMFYDGSSILLSDNMTIDEINSIVYNSLVTTVEAMPLYGKLEDKTLALTVGSTHTVDGHTGFRLTEPVSISLSRSLAKVGVYAAAVSGVTTDPVISSITFKSAGRRNLSYLFPAADDVALKTRDASISSLSSDRVFDLVADGRDVLSNNGTVDKRLPASNIDVDAVVTDHYTEILAPFYLAELPYGSSEWNVPAGAEGRPMVLVIEYSLGAGTVRKYAEINMPAIERNHFYQVRCLIKADGQIYVNVSVNPWTEGEDWDLSFDFPTHNNPLFATSSWNDVEGKYQHNYQTPATTFYAGISGSPVETGAFSVDFNMSYPTGGKWQPAIRDASNTDFELRMYERGSSEPLSDHTIVVTDENKDRWYTIKVVPLKSENIGKKVTISIVYTNIYVGSDYSYLLQINGGEENNLAWTEFSPVADDAFEASTVDIVVTQIDTPTGI